MSDLNKPKVDLIIQARMGSKRLPGKSLFDLAGEPLVGRILERVIRCKNIDDVILAIPNTEENKPLSLLAKRYGVSIFKGSENDLVDRYFQAANLFKSDYICRLPADNPTPEPSEIDKIVDYHLSLDKKGFTSNLAEIKGSGYPDGIGAEIFSFDLLSYVRDKYSDPLRREHVHRNFYDYETGHVLDEMMSPVNTLQCPIEFQRPDLILDVNTHEQYLFMKQLYEYLYPLNNKFSIIDIINWYDNIYSKNK